MDLKLGIKQLRQDVNKATKQINKVGRSVKKQGASFDSMRNSTVRLVRQLETLVVAYYAVSRGMKHVVSEGVKLNAMYESQTLGIAALTASKVKMYDSTGTELSSYERFIAAQQMSSNVIEDIRKAATQTPASVQQMLGFYQQSIGYAINSNKNFGESMEEVNSNVILFTQRMSSLGSAIGMPMDRLDEEMRALMSGNASADSNIAKMLFGSPAQANRAVKDASNSINGVSDLLLGALEPFKHLEGIMTFDKAIAQLKASFQDIQKEGTLGIFEDIKDIAISLTEYLKGNLSEIVSFYDSWYGQFRGQIMEFWDMMNDGDSTLRLIFTSFGEIFDTVVDIVTESLTAVGIFDEWTDTLSTSESISYALKKGMDYFLIGIKTVQLALYGVKKILIGIRAIWDSVSTGSTASYKESVKLLKAYEGNAEGKTWEQYRKENAALTALNTTKIESNEIDAATAKLFGDIQDRVARINDTEGEHARFNIAKARNESRAKEHTLLRAINTAKTEEGRINATLAAQTNANGDARMLKKIGDRYSEVTLKAEAYAKVKKIVMTGGGGDDKAAKAAEKARKKAAKDAEKARKKAARDAARSAKAGAKARGKINKAKLKEQKDLMRDIEKAQKAQYDKEMKAYKKHQADIKKIYDSIGDGITNAFGTILDGDLEEAFGNAVKGMISSLIALAVKLAIVGIANQAQGEAYSAFTRMAAMAAEMAALGIAVAIGGGGGGAQTSEEWNKDNEL